MPIRIKNLQTVAALRELALQRGVGPTAAIGQAVREMLERLHSQAVSTEDAKQIGPSSV